MSSDYTWEWEQVELSCPSTSMHFSFNTEPATLHMLGIVSMGHVSDLALHVNCWFLSMPIIMLASTSADPLVICVPLSISFSEPVSFQIWRSPCGSSLQHAKLQPSLVPIGLSHSSLQLTVLNNVICSFFFYTQKMPYMPQFSQNSTEKILATELPHSYLPRGSQLLLLSPVSFTLLSPVHLTLSLYGKCF